MNLEARSRNDCCRGKAISITYYECVSVAVVIQRAMRMPVIILSCATSRALTFFRQYLINGTTFEKNLLKMKCVLILSTTFI
jgi:hypothetical protein